jgi:hypothetical protein
MVRAVGRLASVAINMAVLAVASGLRHVFLANVAALHRNVSARRCGQALGDRAEVEAELLFRVGEGLLSYASCAAVLSISLLLLASLRARRRTTAAAVRVASARLVATTITLAGLCYWAVLVVIARIR